MRGDLEDGVPTTVPKRSKIADGHWRDFESLIWYIVIIWNGRGSPVLIILSCEYNHNKKMGRISRSAFNMRWLSH